MLSNLQHALIDHKWVRILFDVVYILFPILLTYSFVKDKNIHKPIALATALFSLLYCLLFSTMSVVSIEVYVAWMLVPILFCARTTKGFYFLMHSLRIIFIIIFFSAALWKLFTAAIFNEAQMSAVLLTQHANYLASANNDIFGNVILYLIRHKGIAHTLYLGAFFIEFIFVVGFFTKRFDWYLIVFFSLFLIFDYFIMGINYFLWLPFAGCLYFSKYEMEN
jgi:hypothetical protein